MAKKVGFVITFSGDTKKLDSALKGTIKQVRECQNAVKSLSELTKINPKYTEAYTQKQKALEEQVKSTGEQLEKYKQLAEEEDQKLAEGKTTLKDWAEAHQSVELASKAFKGAKKALDEYNPVLDQASQKALSIGDNFKEASSKVEKVSGVFKTVGGALTKSITAPIAGIAAAAVKVGMDFDSSMSQVQATMGITKSATSQLNGQTVNTFDSLKKLAQEMGTNTKFSAKESADAINYLALAGYDTQKIYGTLPSVMTLAAAGNMDLASASDMVTDAMSAMGLGAEESTKFVDQMAKTASSTNTDVSLLGEAILSIGPTAKTLKGGTAELNTALGILANNGIKGAEGGTHLRNILLALQSPTDKAAGALDSLGISVFDSEGNMRSLNDILTDLSNSMDGMTSEKRTNIISTIFNKTDLASAQTLLDNCGNSWTDLQNKITDSSGAAQQMADTQLDNFAGQLTLLKSALEGAGDAISDRLTPYLAQLTGHVQNAVNWFNSLDDGTKDMIVKIGLIVATIGPAISIIGAVTGVISSMFGMMGTISTFIGSTLIPAIGAISAPVIAVIAIIGAVIAILVNLYNSNENFRNKVNEIAESIWNKLKSLWNSLEELFGTIMDYIKQFVDWISPYASAFFDYISEEIGTMFEGIMTVIDGALTWIQGIIDAFIGLVTGDWDKFWQGIKEILDGMLGVLGGLIQAFFGPMIDWFADIWNGIKSVTSNIWNGIKDFFKGVIDGIVDGIKTKFENAKNTVTNIFNAIKDAIMNPMNTAKDFIKGVIDTIKGFFSFNISWPHIPMPHFGIKPRGWSVGDLLKGSIPKLSINWYAKAMDKPVMLDGAQIFGMMNGKLLGGGEAGREVVMSEEQMKKLSTGNTVNQTNNITIVQRDGENPKELAKRVAKEIKKIIDKDEGVFA